MKNEKMIAMKLVIRVNNSSTKLHKMGKEEINEYNSKLLFVLLLNVSTYTRGGPEVMSMCFMKVISKGTV